jgi:hypothetical protein
LAVSYSGGWSIVPPVTRPLIGQRSSAPRILSERLVEGGRYAVSMEGIAGRSYVFRLRAPGAADRAVTVTFPPTGANTDGYTALTLTFGG